MTRRPQRSTLFPTTPLFRSLPPPAPAMTEAYAWATNLYAAAGDFERVRAALAAFSARLAVRLEPAQAYAATVTLLSGSESGPIAPVVLPDGLRRAVREALRAELEIGRASCRERV